MISLSRSLVFASVITALSTTACSLKKAPEKQKPPSTVDIFSDRPIGPSADVFVVTLNSPALMSVASRSAQGWKVAEADKTKVLQEQAEFERQLKEKAPDAQVLFRYRMTLNGLAILADARSIAEISRVAGVKSVTSAKQMSRPESMTVAPGQTSPEEVNSATFIGAKAAYERGITGRGMRVGILDTGIDYTHGMLGGSGNKDEFTAIDPARPSSLFPNAKIVGGIDLAGSDFDASSPLPSAKVPRPDANPIDEAGHGTHVAGTVAGLGDGKNTYDGVAKDADLYAIKVFGKGGSTMDAVVIAGFEYAADPNGDLDLNDQLDVINLSLGGGFGQPQILYTEAVRNLARTGMVVVASAGNSGPVDYVVGAPSTADDAISVAPAWTDRRTTGNSRPCGS
ncbi:MAG: S8 family serine peptidase [Calothrix sp. SM1_5_4]|nr:S8 family serine peptidase [Calothrix sp. SM1_5_4]